MKNFVSFNDKNARVFPQELLWNCLLAYSCLLKIDQLEIIFKTCPNMPPFEEKVFSAYEYFGFLKGDSWGFFLGILHIFLNVSAKFQLYNIFFFVKL